MCTANRHNGGFAFLMMSEFAIIKLMANQVITQILIYLADFAKFGQNLTGNINVSGLRYDWLIIFFFVFVILLVAWSLGRTRTLFMLLSLYAASFLESHFVYFDKVLEWLKSKPSFAEFSERDPALWLHIGLFLAIYAVVFGILNFSVIKQRLTMAEGSLAMVTFLAILEISLLASILLSYFPEGSVKYLSPKLISYFATKTAQFWWAVAPLFVLIFSKKKKEKAQNPNPY